MDAGDYITKLPEAKHTAPEWQAAMEALILVVTLGGPTMFAQIGVVKGKRDFPRTLTPAVLMDCPSIGRYRAVQAVAALWKLMGSRSVISASPAR